MTRHFDVIIERDPDGTYIASVPQLPGCHTQASTLDELMSRVREAAELYVEVLSEEEAAEMPELEFVGVQRITVAA